MEMSQQQASFDQLSAQLKELQEKSNAKAARAKPHFWQVENAPVWVKIGKETYKAIVLEYRHMGDFDGDWCKLQLTKTVKGLNGKPITRVWVHPKPVQSYKLKKRVE
jgi:endo-alpha-1,4-polygalactosaminidase (GH114 family)